MARNLVSSGSPFEKSIGFSRGCRVGNLIAIAGTAPIAADGSVAAPGDLYGQTKRCLEIIKTAVESAGGRLEHVIRTRIFLTDMARWKEAAQAHGEYFTEIRPASAFIGCSALINPEWLVEIEADCYVE
jgi:enamine deaminase RidA (YjgF/YER057c/UK114 family)